MEGKVKWFNSRKGFGFVEGEDGQDYFIHHSALEQGVFLRENDAVTFEAAETDKGKQAQKVVLKGSKSSAPKGRKAPKEEPTEEESDKEDIDSEDF
ncbi:cold shock domain-containing protein [Candidatus Woesearchaeota archaeon]|nr:cold shock domain-containing protein [Candidatus Woesearchaeota archaeon]